MSPISVTNADSHSCLVLKQILVADGPSLKRAAAKAPPKRAGDIWATVAILKEPQTSSNTKMWVAALLVQRCSQVQGFVVC
jgi:hypothetical protein